MASLIPNDETQGRVLRRIEFDPVGGGRRQRIRLGKVTGREGNDFKRRVEEIVVDLRLGQRHTASLCDWLNALPADMQQRLQRVGLIEAAKQNGTALGDFLDGLEERAAVKESTKITYSNTIWNLMQHFGRGRAIQTITAADAIGFKEYLHTPAASRNVKPLSKATISRRVVMVRQFFTAAKQRELITKNPFEGVKGGSQRNAERLEFVLASWVDQLIEATGDRDWKLLLALGRYGGIRIPSEVVKLRWRDVDFARSRILIHAVKTEHFEGHETRYIPIFDELRRPFLSAFNEGVDSTDFVIRNPAYRQPKANLRQQFGRIAERAGVKVWGKPWQNMRATRETELIERLTLKEACKIIGNGELVALQHYQMLRPQYLETAIERDRAARKEAQKAAHQTTEWLGNERKAVESLLAHGNITDDRVGGYPPDSAGGSGIPTELMGDTGLEPVTSGV